MTQSTEFKKQPKREIVEGKAMLRLVNYVETGKHMTTFNGVDTPKEKVEMVFEVFGKNYPLENGQPLLVKVKENYSLYDKSNFKKLFMMMRGGDTGIKHMSEMLGKAFMGNVYKYSYNGNEYPTLKNSKQEKGELGYKVAPAVLEDPETGETKQINVPQPIGPLRKFVWAAQTKEDWDSLYIEGQYPDGNSKNTYQDTIKKALNFPQSDINFILNGVTNKPERVVEKVEKPKSNFKPEENPYRKTTSRFARTSVNLVQPQVAEDQIDDDDELFKGI